MKIYEVNYLKSQIDRKYGDGNGKLDKKEEIMLFNEQLVHHANSDMEVIEKYLMRVPEPEIQKQVDEIVQGCDGHSPYADSNKRHMAVACGFLSAVVSALSIPPLLETNLPVFAQWGIPGLMATAGVIGTIALYKHKKKEDNEIIKENIAKTAAILDLQSHKEKAEKDIKTMSSAPFLGEEKGRNIGEILVNNGFEDLDYAKVNDDLQSIFMKRGGKNIEFRCSQSSENVFNGVLSVINDNNESELYLAQVEYIDAAVSTKMKVSLVRIVQNDVGDDAEYYVKEDVDFAEHNITKETNSSHTETKLRALVGPILIGKCENTSENSKEIEQFIRNIRPECKQVIMLEK